ncbi:MAG: MATE family efflux transporter, partial [Proteobacteria bacterium]|nr:MATE family efflux transporter [Pseudomonadota bacterium]
MGSAKEAIIKDTEITPAKTKGVETLLGDPKKALVKLAVPAVISSLIGAIYQITDIIWVSGLGADALAVMGYVGPFFLVVMAVGSCWAAGGGINISKKIGENDKKGADELAENAFALSLVVSVVLCLLFVVSAKPLLLLMGAEKVLDSAANMVYIIGAGAFVQMSCRVAGSILYNEGDAKRTMAVSLVGVLLNI